MSFGNALELAILDHVFGGPDYSRPANISVALYTTAPDFETGTGGTEVSGAGYSRPSVVNNSTNFPAASAGSKSNGTAVSFGTSGAAWGTVVAFGYFNGSTWMAGANLAASKVIDASDPVSFEAGTLTISLSGCSTYLANALLNHVFGGPDYTRPATLHPALFSTMPNLASGAGGAELSGGGYSRPSVANNSTNFPAASAGRKSNGTEITFATPSAQWSVDGWGIYDASSTGNFLFGVDIPNKTINSGDPPKFAVNALGITLN